MLLLTELVQILRDLVLAIAGAFTRIRGRHYEYGVHIAAPRSVVWQMLRARSLTYDGMIPMHVETEVVEGRAGVERSVVQVGQRQMTMTTRIAREIPGEALVIEILPDGSDPAILMGADDYLGLFLADAGDGTRLLCTRDLVPARWHAGVTVPLGLRSGLRRYKATAERMARSSEAERQPAGLPLHLSGDAPPAQPGEMPIARSSFGLTPNGILFSLIALASFSYLWGWKQALLLAAIIILHELGHALAMLMVGIPVKGVYLVPFFGGAAIAGAPYRSEAQNGFVALMGPGFSLLPTLAFVLAANETGAADWRRAAELSAIVNLINLAPIYPLDGGQVLKAVLVSVNRWLAQAVGVAGAVAGLWLAWRFGDPILGFFMLLGILAALQIRKPSTMAPMRWPGALVMFAAFLATAAAYAAVLYVGFGAPS